MGKKNWALLQVISKEGERELDEYYKNPDFLKQELDDERTHIKPPYVNRSSKGRTGYLVGGGRR